MTAAWDVSAMTIIVCRHQHADNSNPCFYVFRINPEGRNPVFQRMG